MSWPLVEFGEVATFINGDRGKNYPSKGSFIKEGIPFISAGNLSGEELNPNSFNYISEERYNLLSNGKVKESDILFCLRGSLGKFAVVKGIERGAIASSLVIIRNNEKITLNFLKHYLGSPLCQREINQFENGAAQPNLSAKDLKSFKIPLPPLDEQKRIAAILDKADSVRRKRQQAIDLVDEFLRNVFLDMFGDPVTNPKGWEVKPLSELIAKGDKLNYGVVQPGDNVDDGVPLIRSGDLGDTGTDLNKIRKVSNLIDEKHKKSRLKGNEILIACVGSIGKVGWVNESMIGWNIARAVTRIPLSNDVNREYVYRYLQSPVIQGYFQRETRAVAQPTLNVGLIGKTPIALPPMELQEEFLKIFSNVVSIKRKYSENGARDSELFNAISQKAFAGEL